MSWSKRGRGKSRRGYHHGDLREALVQAALGLIADKGPAGFTFAEAARETGVSAAAPYRHFRDRDDLLADVARRGFEQLQGEMSEAWNGGKPNTFAAFKSIGAAYLSFARREPAYYAAMFEAGLPPDISPDLSRASDAALGVLRDAAEELSADLPRGERPPAMMMALHVWSLSHGIASLFARGDAARRKLPMPPEDLMEAAVLIYLRGLGIGAR